MYLHLIKLLGFISALLYKDSTWLQTYFTVFWIRQPNTYCVIIWACGKDAAFNVHAHHSHPLPMSGIGFYTVSGNLDKQLTFILHRYIS